MATKTVSGFGKTVANGTYSDTGAGTKDGYARYVNGSDSNLILEYRSEFGPYCFSGSYYIIQLTETEGAIRIEKPLYKNNNVSPTGGTWITLQDVSSGSNTIGTVA